VEIYFLIQVGSQIGVLATIFTVIATAMLGASLVRREGLRTMHSLQERMERKELPGRELLDGAMLLLAGALLVTPGFFTDGVGFLLAMPWSRGLLRARLMTLLSRQIHTQAAGMGGMANKTNMGHMDGSGGKKTGSGQSVIEGQFQRHPEDSNSA